MPDQPTPKPLDAEAEAKMRALYAGNDWFEAAAVLDSVHYTNVATCLRKNAAAVRGLIASLDASRAERDSLRAAVAEAEKRATRTEQVATRMMLAFENYDKTRTNEPQLAGEAFRDLEGTYHWASKEYRPEDARGWAACWEQEQARANALAAELGEARKEVRIFERLSHAQGRLLINYRTGHHMSSAAAVDAINKAEAELAARTAASKPANDTARELDAGGGGEA